VKKKSGTAAKDKKAHNDYDYVTIGVFEAGWWKDSQN
jgi:hypothetical protein